MIRWGALVIAVAVAMPVLSSGAIAAPGRQSCTHVVDPTDDNDGIPADPAALGPPELDIVDARVTVVPDELVLVMSLAKLTRPLPGRNFEYTLRFTYADETSWVLVAGLFPDGPTTAAPYQSDRFFLTQAGVDPRDGQAPSGPVGVVTVRGAIDWARSQITVRAPAAALGPARFGDRTRFGELVAETIWFIGNVGFSSDYARPVPSSLTLGKPNRC